MNNPNINVQRRTNHFIDVLKVENDVAVISNDFKNKVLTHIIGNYNESIKVPLFLAIHGNPGEGKTFQTFQICNDYGVRVCYFSGAELSGNYEKDSILDFDENYKRACNYFDSREYSVIIVDDFHLSPASTKEGVGTTINSQLLTGYLMNLCDKAQNGQCQSIPIILLGNTFTNVYEPLKRDGRMDFFYWEAPYEIKRKVAYELLSPYLNKIEIDKFEKFVLENKNMPVSFFTEIKNDIDKQKIWDFLNQNVNQDISYYINRFGNTKNASITISQLYVLAQKRRESSNTSKEGGKWIL